ncbi:MAG: tetratricopeptide repeat protein [Kofleriaceae bacterium]|nr:tetratricopeptide repeat protein [Kofleriaceae bacterium]
MIAPSLATPFLGREKLLDELEHLVGNPHRLITLWGPAGIGKTRLATEYQRRREQGNIIFCDLSTCESLAEVCRVLWGALHLPSSASSDDLESCTAIGDALVAADIDLLLLDNCEQIPDAVTRCQSIWLSASPNLAILVTSRERLRCKQEYVLEIPSLSLPQPGNDIASSPAAQLFAQLAKHAQPDFSLRKENENAILALVQRLDGIPLAIELASAHINMFGLQGLLENIAQQLDILRGPRDAVPRQATLRSAISWSWQLLTNPEKRVLVESSRFTGGFSLEAALHVLTEDDDTLETIAILQSLRDKSMIRASEHKDVIRFSHYQSIQLFAQDIRLSSENDNNASAQYHRYFVDLAISGYRAIEEKGCPISFATLCEERRNLLEVLSTTLASKGTIDAASDAIELALALDNVLSAEGPLLLDLTLLKDTLAFASDFPVPHWQLNRMYRALGKAYLLQGEFVLAENALKLALKKYSEGLTSETWTDLGIVYHGHRDLEQAESCYNNALETQTPNTASRSVAKTLGNLAAIALDQGDILTSKNRHREAIALLRKVGDSRLEATALSNLAIVDVELGQFDEARVHIRSAVRTLESLGDRRSLGIALDTMAAVEHIEGYLEEALTIYERAIATQYVVGDQRSRAMSLGRLGAIMACIGEPAEALGHIDEAERILDGLGAQTAREAIGITRHFLSIPKIVRAKLDGNNCDAKERISALRLQMKRASEGESPLIKRSDDARTLLGLLDSTLTQLESGELANDGHGLVVGPYARWFRVPDGQWQELRSLGTIRKILYALVIEKRRSPGSRLPMMALQAAGWPEESIQVESGANRVYVALNKLRKMGFDGIILRSGSGYYLNPEIEVHRTFIDWRLL